MPARALNKASRLLLIDLINEANQTAFTAADLAFSPPAVLANEARNTRVSVTGTGTTTLTGNRPVDYDRLDLSVMFGALNVAIADDTGYLTTLDLLPVLNGRYTLAMDADDIVDEPLVVGPAPRTQTIRAKSTSYLYTGEFNLSLGTAAVPEPTGFQLTYNATLPAAFVDQTPEWGKDRFLVGSDGTVTLGLRATQHYNNGQSYDGPLSDEIGDYAVVMASDNEGWYVSAAIDMPGLETVCNEQRLKLRIANDKGESYLFSPTFDPGQGACQFTTDAGTILAYGSGDHPNTVMLRLPMTGSNFNASTFNNASVNIENYLYGNYTVELYVLDGQGVKQQSVVMDVGVTDGVTLPEAIIGDVGFFVSFASGAKLTDDFSNYQSLSATTEPRIAASLGGTVVSGENQHMVSLLNTATSIDVTYSTNAGREWCDPYELTDRELIMEKAIWFQGHCYFAARPTVDSRSPLTTRLYRLVPTELGPGQYSFRADYVLDVETGYEFALAANDTHLVVANMFGLESWLNVTTNGVDWARTPLTHPFAIGGTDAMLKPSALCFWGSDLIVAGNPLNVDTATYPQELTFRVGPVGGPVNYYQSMPYPEAGWDWWTLDMKVIDDKLLAVFSDVYDGQPSGSTVGDGWISTDRCVSWTPAFANTGISAPTIHDDGNVVAVIGVNDDWTGGTELLIYSEDRMLTWTSNVPAGSAPAQALIAGAALYGAARRFDTLTVPDLTALPFEENPIKPDPVIGVGESGVRFIEQQSEFDSSLYVAGRFVNFEGVQRDGLVKCFQDGSVNPSFNAGYIAGGVQGMAVVGSWLYIAGDQMTTVGVTPVRGMARLNVADGTIDPSFPVHEVLDFWGFESRPSQVVRYGDAGQVLVAGTKMWTVGGVQTQGLARLNADGSVDTGFVTPLQPTSATNMLDMRVGHVFADGRVLVSGRSDYDRPLLLTASGAIDPSFPNLQGGTITKVLELAGGAFIVFGYDFTYNAEQRTSLKFNADLTIDPTFNCTAYAVSDAVILPENQLLVGGLFSDYGTAMRDYLAIVDGATGAESGSQPPLVVNGPVHALHLQGGGTWVVGGDFGMASAGTYPRKMAVAKRGLLLFKEVVAGPPGGGGGGIPM